MNDLLALVFVMFMGLSAGYSQGQLKYGDEIHLQNGWDNYSGGFLDTRGYDRDFEKTGNHLCVSTATTNVRATGTGTWKVLSAKGKAIGDPVLIGDEIHLQNGWDNYTGGFLDARGYQKDFAKTGNHLSVSTATIKNRDIGSGTWKILSYTGKANGTPVTQNLEVHLQNGWNNYSGGFLDTRGYQKDYAKTGNHLCVSTANEKNRQNSGSGVWKVQIISASKDAAVVVKPGTPNSTAYGKKLIKPYNVVERDADNFYIGLNNLEEFQVIDETSAKPGTIISFEIRYIETKKAAVLQDTYTGKFVTADASGNISLTAVEQVGSYWTITAPVLSDARLTGHESLVSLKSKHPSLKNNYLRHQNLNLYAWDPTSTANDSYFMEAAVWNFVDLDGVLR